MGLVLVRRPRHVPRIHNEPQSDAIDWLVILFVFLGIAAKIYSVRRAIDLRHEVVRRRKAETEAYQLARHDVLTGLPNRRWFIEDFDKWSCELPAGEACALLVVDLDNFKPINDVYGHRLGDEVLRVIAKRLTRLAEGGSVARLGGDEFGVMRYRLGSDVPERLARSIVHETSKPISLAALSLQVGVSVGVATCDPSAHRNDAMAQRRRQCRNRAAAGGHGHVLGKGGGTRSIPLLRPRHGRTTAAARRA
jgi:diguanylate cyclase (GGDEF)-like protein